LKSKQTVDGLWTPFTSVWKTNTMEVNGAHQLFGYDIQKWGGSKLNCFGWTIPLRKI